MRIQERVLVSILNNTPASPIEKGGILGGKNRIVTHFAFDCEANSYGTYKPTIHYLNRILLEWDRKGISFYGLFHSHFPKNDLLSAGDLHYINTIVETLGGQVDELYFPIVIPKSHLKVYRAYKDCQGVQIECDKIEIINTEESKVEEKKIQIPEGRFCGNCSDCIYYEHRNQDSTGRGYCNYYNTHYYPSERNGCFNYK